MNAQHLKAMQAGRRRAQVVRRRDAIHRVDAFKRWLKRGSKLRDIPEIPSDSDYQQWRERRS